MRIHFSLVCPLAATLIVIMVGCGTEVGNPIIKRPTTPRMIAQDTVEADLFDLTEGLFESEETDDALELTHVGAMTPELNLVGSSCSSDGYQAQARFDADKMRDNLAPTQRYIVSVERGFTVDWKSPQGGLWCDANNRVRKRRALLQGASVMRTGRFVRTLEAVASVDGSEYQSAQFVSEGSKQTLFKKVERVDGGLSVLSSISWKKKRSSLIKTIEGESEDVSSSEVSAASPLKILRRFTTVNGKRSKTFQVTSGTSKTTRTDGSVIEISYENLSFDVQNSCLASSGVISGKIVNSEAQDGDMIQFRIDFSKSNDGRPSIEFSDGQSALLSGACAQ